MRCIITDQAPKPRVPRRNEPALQAEVLSISCVCSIGLPDKLRPCVSLGIMCLSEHSGHRRATCSRGYLSQGSGMDSGRHGNEEMHTISHFSQVPVTELALKYTCLSSSHMEALFPKAIINIHLHQVFC